MKDRCRTGPSQPSRASRERQREPVVSSRRPVPAADPSWLALDLLGAERSASTGRALARPPPASAARPASSQSGAAAGSLRMVHAAVGRWDILAAPLYLVLDFTRLPA